MKNRIKEAIERKGITQRDLSIITGIPEASISRYVNEKHTPDIIKAHILAEALGVTVGYLFLIGGENGK